MTESTLPGGPAALTGFLYQILANLDHVARAQWPTAANGAPDTLTVVLEPAAGDAQYLRSGEQNRLVEQYKTRSGGGTWSVRTLVDEVLPDLFKAVAVGQPATYRFVTDGREGKWRELRRVCQLLHREDSQSQPGASLDDSQQRRFFNDTSPSTKKSKQREAWELPKTDLAFFEYVCRVLVTASTTDGASHAKRVRQLLAGLELNAEASDEKFIASIDALLSQIVEHREDVEGKRRELCTIVLELSAKGNIAITADELLKKAGLNAQPLRDRAQFARLCSHAVRQTLEVTSYDENADVRTPPALGTAQVTILTGESGVGKTWTLCAMARKQLADQSPALLVGARNDSDATLRAISNALWVEARGMDKELPLQAVYRRLGDIPNSSNTEASGWLCTIFLDDVQQPGVARDVAEAILRLPGLRLVLSAPEPVAAALHETLGAAKAPIHRVTRLSRVELRSLLTRRSIPFDQLPGEFLDVLTLPVLARMYCDVGQAGSFVPESEYELFKRHDDLTWKRIEQALHPADRARMLKFVAKTALGKVDYPWELPCEDLGDSEPRLRQIGLLRTTPDRRSLEVWHDRIFNWLVAEALLEERDRGRLPQERLVALLATMYANEPGVGGRRLGYVPMDYLWLSLAESSQAHREDAVSVVRGLASAPSHRDPARSLYEVLLPTLGPRAIDIYQDLLEAPAPWDRESAAIYPSLKNGLIKIGSRGAAGTIAELSSTWLASSNERLVEIAIDLADAFPRVESLDALWSVHKSLDDRIGRLADSDREESFRLRMVKQRCVEALRRGASLSQIWLLDQLLATSDSNDLVSLGYVLVGVTHSVSGPVWAKTKGKLFEHVPNDRRRVLAFCVREFRDRQEVDRMVSWLGQKEDLIGNAAFAALAHIDPDTAVLHVQTTMSQDAPTTSWWAPLLLQLRPSAALSQILAGMRRDVFEGQDVFRGLEDEVDLPIWDFALDELQQRLPRLLERGIQNTPGGMPSPFKFVATVTKPDLLRQLRQRSGSDLERDTCAFAIARLDRLDDFGRGGDDVVREAILLMQRIGGDEYDRFVRAALAHPARTARLWGLGHAMRLAAPVAQDEALRIAKAASQQPSMEAKTEWNMALHLLLQLDDVDSVVELILDSVHEPSPQLIETIRDTHLKEATLPLNIGLAEMLHPSKGARVLLAAVIHGRPASLALVGEALAAMPAGSPAAQVVVDALLRRGVTGEPPQSTLTRMLSERDSRSFATRALLRIGTDRTQRALFAYYGTGAIPDGDRDSAWSALLGLLETPLGDAAALVMRDWYETGQTPVSPHYLRFLPRLGVADAHERLLEIASKDANWHEQQQEAIAGLFAIEPDAALGCAQRLFTRLPDKLRRRFPHELASLGDEAAIPVLCRHVLQEGDRPTRAHVGRSLRRFDAIEVKEHLLSMLEDGRESTRLRGIELAGWQADSLLATELAKLAADDPEPDVRVAAAAACRRQRSERLTLELMAELQSSAGAGLRFALVSTLVERVDPFLAETRGDPLFVFDLFESAREEIHAHAVLWRQRGKEDQTA